MLRIARDVVAVGQEQALVAWLDRIVLSRAEAIETHFDGVLHHAREGSLSRDRLFSFMPEIRDLVTGHLRDAMEGVHVLELRPEGWIDPHHDQHCGAPILGLSLLQPCTMRFMRSGETRDFWLPPRSLYVMGEEAWYRWKHSIIRTDDRTDRRLSLIFRTQPPPSQEE